MSSLFSLDTQLLLKLRVKMLQTEYGLTTLMLLFRFAYI